MHSVPLTRCTQCVRTWSPAPDPSGLCVRGDVLDAIVVNVVPSLFLTGTAGGLRRRGGGAGAVLR